MTYLREVMTRPTHGVAPQGEHICMVNGLVICGDGMFVGAAIMDGEGDRIFSHCSNFVAGDFCQRITLQLG